VVCATNAVEPVVEGAWLKPGAHVNSVGSPRPNWRELDNAVMANTVIVDSREAAAVEAGDVILSGAKVYAEAGEVLAGNASIAPESTTVFKSLGMAVEDIAAAQLVYENYQMTQEHKA
ncbi:MAG: ornithine cyclodeaminase family protein, partial [Hyphomicrobiaceae bacterium]